MDKISLRVWMFLQIIRPAMFFLGYWALARTNHHPIHWHIGIFGFSFFGMFVLFEQMTELVDELAKKSLRRADSICFKTAWAMSVVFIILAFIFSFQDRALNLSWIAIGYVILIMHLVFFVLRAIIFSFIDKKGDIDA